MGWQRTQEFSKKFLLSLHHRSRILNLLVNVRRVSLIWLLKISLLRRNYHWSIEFRYFKSFGVRLSIIGHSERRALGETNEIVAEKIKVALKENIIPLLCVGESERDREGEYLEFIRHEIGLSL